MIYIYNNIQEIRVAEFMLLELNETKLILAQMDSPTQTRTMATAHSIATEFWINKIIY